MDEVNPDPVHWRLGSARQLRNLLRTVVSSLVFSFFLATALGAIRESRLVPGNQRKALVLGSGRRLPGEGTTHPEGAKINFLRLVGNPGNDPRKGWTCDLSWDLMLKLGMNPTNTQLETLFRYIGEHRLGYRIVINNGASGYALSIWGEAADNGMMPFAPQGNNTRGLRLDDPIGIRAAVSVAGGPGENVTTYGGATELIDALPLWASNVPWEDAAQSWANQAVAAKFARILDAHPSYNIWDARQHLRQAASFWTNGWSEMNGYGRVNENAVVGKLLPGPPVEFYARKSRSRHQVIFTWRNFLQSDFAATVIARKDGRILYEGRGTNLVWTSDVDGDETFLYWSKNNAGEKSRMESYQTRMVTGLNFRLNRTCLVLGAPARENQINAVLQNRFQHVATNWVCDMVYRSGDALSDGLARFPQGPVVAVLPDFSAMVDYAISNNYRIVIVPASQTEDDLYRFKNHWDRATAAGILVVLPHYVALTKVQALETRTLSPPRLFSAVTVGVGMTNSLRSFGPGLEFVDASPVRGAVLQEPAQYQTATIAGKLAQIFDANPNYNPWDARQHLRQSASHYAHGWREDGGYGCPPESPATITTLDIAPPPGIEVVRAPDGKSVTFSWMNFRQTSFAETVILRGDGQVIYHGTGTNFTWRCDTDGKETFRFHSKDKSDRLSRNESYAASEITGLSKN
jgi:hypothetical protein